MSKSIQNLPSKTDLKEIVNQIGNLPAKITTEEQYLNAHGLYKSIKEAQKELDSKKQPILKPLLESAKQVRALFKPFETTLEEMSTELKSSLTLYVNEKEAARLKELERINNDGRLSKVETIMAKMEAAGERADATMKVKKVKRLHLIAL